MTTVVQELASGTSPVAMKRTLSLWGLMMNAMALIAPGAFLWTTFQIQAAQTSGGITTGGEMWTGLVIALVIAFLTAFSYSELARIYPTAGAGSSYFYSEAAFLDQKASRRRWAVVAKFAVGWVAHLYYWIYPGIMVAFTAILVGYVLSVFNVILPMWELIAIAVAFALVNGFVAYRGIHGSTLTSAIINAIQLVSLIVFSILAIMYRQMHPEIGYATSASSIVIPHNFTNLLFQSTIAILLLVGFESVTALGAESVDPKRDIRKAAILSLAIQGGFAYLFEYFAANYFVGNQITSVTAGGQVISGYGAVAASAAPIGDMLRIIGDTMLRGTGPILALIVAGTVIVALIGTTLACMNTAVRVTYSIGKDSDVPVPSIFANLHQKHATPHLGILVMVGVSAAIGAYGVLNIDNLTQITLASNTGTFLVYAATNLIALIAFLGRRGSRFLQHKLIPAAGFSANVFMLAAVVYLSLEGGGTTSTDTTVALSMVMLWIVVGAGYYVINRRRRGYPLLMDASFQSPNYVCGCSREQGCSCLLLEQLDGLTNQVSDMFKKHKLSVVQTHRLMTAAQEELNKLG